MPCWIYGSMRIRSFILLFHFRYRPQSNAAFKHSPWRSEDARTPACLNSKLETQRLFNRGSASAEATARQVTRIRRMGIREDLTRLRLGTGSAVASAVACVLRSSEFFPSPPVWIISPFASCLDHFSPSRRSLGIGGSLIRACFGFRYSDFSPSTFLTLLCPPLLPIIRVIRARHGGARPKAKAGNPRFNSPFRFPPRRAVGRFPKFFVPPAASASHVVGRGGDRRWKPMPRRPLTNAFGVASA